jgi:HEXXH motif-containing protein
MTSLTGFEPCEERALALDRRMRVRLGDSLNYIAEQIGDRIAMDASARQAFYRRLDRDPVPALTFGAYSDLVIALDEDRQDLAQALLAEIFATPNRPADLVIRDLTDPRTDPAADRYVRMIDTDPTASFIIEPPPPEVSSKCRARLAGALDVLEAGDHELFKEIHALIGEIVLAVGTDDPTGLNFDGASSFMLWGSILINADGHKTVLEVAQALAHESGHNLLFGLCADGPLVDDGDELRYPSPLRVDPRPMDGIVHAAYVTARMHRNLVQLLRSGVLDAGATAEAYVGLAAHQRAFTDGMTVVDEHACLTDLGVTIMETARVHMANAAS